MGEYATQQPDLIATDFLGQTNILGISTDNEANTYTLTHSYSNHKSVPDVCSRISISDGFNTLNGVKNFNRVFVDENLQNNFSDPLNLMSTDFCGISNNDNVNNNSNNNNINGNSGGIELGSTRQGRFNRFQQIPVVFALVPQISVIHPLTKTHGPAPFCPQIPIISTEPLYLKKSQQYFRVKQPTRNLECPWYKEKVPYGQDRSSIKRSFGPIGSELAGLKCRGVALRNFPSTINMVRRFSDNRVSPPSAAIPKPPSPLHSLQLINNNNNNSARSMKCWQKQHCEITTQRQHQQKQQHYNANFIDKVEENLNYETKYCLFSRTEDDVKLNQNTFVTSVHLGGLLTIPRGIEHTIDNSSQSSNLSDKSSNTNSGSKEIININSFKESAIQGCYEIQNLIKQYNIKSSTINIENFCKNVQRQFNISKNIMQMEPIMREMILGYLYLSNSWMSLASVLAEPRDHSQPLDNCLKELTEEFVVWQKKTKIMLEQIIISLKKIPKEHEKYIPVINQQPHRSSSSDNSTNFSDESFTDYETSSRDGFKQNYWENRHDNKRFPINETKKEFKENLFFSDTYSVGNNNENLTEINCRSKMNYMGPIKSFRPDLYQSQKGCTSFNERIHVPRDISLNDGSSYQNEHRYSQNTTVPFSMVNGKRNYTSNRSLIGNRCNTPISSRINRKK